MKKEILAEDTTNNETTIVDTTGDTISTSLSMLTLPTVFLYPNPSVLHNEGEVTLPYLLE